MRDTTGRLSARRRTSSATPMPVVSAVSRSCAFSAAAMRIQACDERGGASPSERHRRRLRSDGCEKRTRRVAAGSPLTAPCAREAKRQAGGAKRGLGRHMRRQPHVSGQAPILLSASSTRWRQERTQISNGLPTGRRQPRCFPSPGLLPDSGSAVGRSKNICCRMSAVAEAGVTRGRTLEHQVRDERVALFEIRNTRPLEWLARLE